MRAGSLTESDRWNPIKDILGPATTNHANYNLIKSKDYHTHRHPNCFTMPLYI